MALTPLSRGGIGNLSSPCDYDEGSIQACDGVFEDDDANYEVVTLTAMDSTVDGVATQKSPLLAVALKVVGGPPVTVYDCTSGSCGGGPPNRPSVMQTLRVRKALTLDAATAEGPVLTFPLTSPILAALRDRLSTLNPPPDLLQFHVYKFTTTFRTLTAGGYIAIPIAGEL